jgi:hypothetical protein
MELDLQKFIWAPCTQLYSLTETPHLSPSPRIWAHIRVRWRVSQDKRISLWPPGCKCTVGVVRPLGTLFKGGGGTFELVFRNLPVLPLYKTIPFL